MKKCPHCHGTGVAPNWKRLARELRRRRVVSGISLRKAARGAGISSAHLSDMELGRRSMGGPGGVRALTMYGLHVEHAFTRPLEKWTPEKRS